MPPLSPFSKSCVALAVSQLMLSSQASNAATIIVDSNADNGVGCTLREAIVSANTDVDQQNGCAVGSVSGTDTITFNNSTLTSNTITLTGGSETTSSGEGEGYDNGLYISNKDIEINASTISGGITIDANQSRAIYVASQSDILFDLEPLASVDTPNVSSSGTIELPPSQQTTLVLNNITLTNGNGGYSGGAMSVVAYGAFESDSSTYTSVTLDNCTLVGNSAVGSGGLGGEFADYSAGGAVFVGAFGGSVDLSLNNTTVTGNVSGNGGAIYVNGENINVALTNSTLTNNSVSSSGGAVSISGSGENIDVTLTNSTLTNNSASSNGGAVYIGGPFAFFGGSDEAEGINLTIDNSRIEDNTAVEGVGFSSESSGGAIYASGASSSVAVTKSSISGNQADYAGAIQVSGGAALTVTNSTISGNSVTQAASAIRSSSGNSPFDPIVLEGTFGGSPIDIDPVYNRVEIINSTISNNVSKNEGLVIPVDETAAVFIDSGSLSITNSILANTDGEANCNFNLDSDDLLQVDSSSIIEGDFGAEGGPLVITTEGVIEGFVLGASCGASRANDPGVLDLADNDGALSHALSADSIARNTSSGTCEPFDQAGQVRNVTGDEGSCDVGALEFNPSFVTSPTTPYVIRLPNGKVVVFEL